MDRQDTTQHEHEHPKGVVRKVNEDTIEVFFCRSSACGDCEACGLLKETGEMNLEFKNNGDVKVGDKVNVLVDEKFFLVSALLLYGLPLVVLMLGVGISSIFFNEGYAQMLSALIGVSLSAATYFVLKRFDGYFAKLKTSYMKYTVDVTKEL